jgi:tetratricopeptide (TPR) repeat protein/TolB-like protein
MNKYFRFVIICLLEIMLTTFTSSLCFALEELDVNLDHLASRIVTAMDENVDKTLDEKIRIAVMDFLDLEGNITSLGRFIAEELTTRLFLEKRFEVIERQLLDKVLQELKLNVSGFVDPGSAQELGNILGVSAIVSGTLSDLGNTVKINARLIATTTGTIFAAASVQIIKDEAVEKLLNRVITAPVGFLPSFDPLPSAIESPEVVMPIGGEDDDQNLGEIDVGRSAEELKKFLPNEEEVYKNLIERALSEKDYINAFSLCQEAIIKFPGFGFAYAVLGYTYLHIQPIDREQALTALEKAIVTEEYPLGDGYTYYLLGRLYRGQGRRDEARLALEKGINRYQKINYGAKTNDWYEDAVKICIELYQEEINACWQREEYGQALSLSQQAIFSFDAAFAYAAQGYSLLKLDRNNVEEALTSLRKGTELADYPAYDGWTYYVLGWAYLERGERENAQQALEKAVIRCQQVYFLKKPDWYHDCVRHLKTIYNEQTQIFLEKQEYASLISFLQEKLGVLEDYAYGYVVLGFCNLKTGEAPERTIAVLHQALDLEEDLAGDGWVHYLLGWAYKEKAEYFLAKNSLTKALEQGKTGDSGKGAWIVSAQSLLQECYEQLFYLFKLRGGSYKQYLALAEDSLALINNFAYGYAVKGYCLMNLAPRRLDEAITTLEEALVIAEDPTGDGWTYYVLGWAYKEKGEKKKAVTYLEKAQRRCEQCNPYPLQIPWYKQCTSLLRALSKQSTKTIGLCLTQYDKEEEPYLLTEIGFGKGIPFEYYTGLKFRVGCSEKALLGELGTELGWEGELFPKKGFLGWYTMIGGGFYGAYLTRNFEDCYEHGFYFTFGGGLRIYPHQNSGFRLTLGTEYQNYPRGFNNWSLVAAISLPSVKRSQSINRY